MWLFYIFDLELFKAKGGYKTPFLYLVYVLVLAKVKIISIYFNGTGLT
jgi:hypothetical protein